MTDTRTFAPASGNYGAILAQYIVFTKAYSPQNSVDKKKSFNMNTIQKKYWFTSLTKAHPFS